MGLLDPAKEAFGRQFSTDDTTYADESHWHRMLYRFMEFTGLSTF
ncbi:hypothetical protein [Aliidiomarina indica]|nr:hypothetical protein [Aliidiomarina indica]